MEIRKYKSADCAEILELFYHTVHEINIKDYTKQQLDAWATGNVDMYAWDKSFLEHNTLVAEEKKSFWDLAIWIKTAILTGYMFIKTIKGKALPQQLQLNLNDRLKCRAFLFLVRMRPLLLSRFLKSRDIRLLVTTKSLEMV